jgi:hypothetical protein
LVYQPRLLQGLLHKQKQPCISWLFLNPFGLDRLWRVRHHHLRSVEYSHRSLDRRRTWLVGRISVVITSRTAFSKPLGICLRIYEYFVWVKGPKIKNAIMKIIS